MNIEGQPEQTEQEINSLVKSLIVYLKLDKITDEQFVESVNRTYSHVGTQKKISPIDRSTQ